MQTIVVISSSEAVCNVRHLPPFTLKLGQFTGPLEPAYRIDKSKVNLQLKTVVMSKVIGIDISKQTFDVAWKEKDKNVSMVFDNGQEGFKLFFKHMKKGDHCVMEASGIRNQALEKYARLLISCATFQ